jgi:hypothetical protein
MRSAFVLSTLAFVVPALGAPALVPIIKRDGPVRADSYIMCVFFVCNRTNEADSFVQ